MTRPFSADMWAGTAISMSTTLAPEPIAADIPDRRFFGVDDGPGAIATPLLIDTMLESGRGISDLIFSPGRAPQVEQHGELVSVAVPGLAVLQPEDTARIARDLVGGNAQALRSLNEQGA